MARLLRLLPLFLLLSACSTLRGRADELARNGQFVEAAALYDDLVRQDPKKTELVNARDDLRWRALEQLLGNARRYRLEGQDEKAEEDLLRFLAHRAEWKSKLNGALESSLLEEMEGTHKHFRQLIGAPAQKGLALTAESHLVRKRPLLAHREMVVIQREMESVVAQSGRAACLKLKDTSSEDSPHWRELVFRYCRHWREYAPRPPVPSELLGPPEWSVQLEGLNSAQQARLQARLAQAFEASPWFSPDATPRPSFTLLGRFSTRHGSDSVQRTATWSERVPYTDHEERQETIEEPYEDEEQYTDDKGQKKTRKVTKYRKRTRNFTVPVTRYRDVPRTFEYHALRLSVEHRIALTSTGVLDPGRAPLTTTHQDQFSESGYEHEVTFHPGGVSPQRVSFTPTHSWLEKQVDAMGERFSAQLVEHWRQSYCGHPVLTLDEAARCARSGAALPTQAYRVLSEHLGDDAARVSTLFAQP
jgi:hypothetical protein